MEKKKKSIDNKRLIVRSVFFTATAFLLAVSATLAWFLVVPPSSGQLDGRTSDKNLTAQLYRFVKTEAEQNGEAPIQSDDLLELNNGVSRYELVENDEDYDDVNNAFWVPIWPGVSDYLKLEIVFTGSVTNLTVTLMNIIWSMETDSEDHPILTDDDKNNLAEWIFVNVYTPGAGAYMPDYDGLCTSAQLFQGSANTTSLVILQNYPVASSAVIYFNYHMHIDAVYPPTEGPLFTIGKIRLAV